MREFKFRIILKNKIISNFSFVGLSATFCAPPDSVVEQYTGLQDRNGEDIYEGDIVLERRTFQKLRVFFTGSGFYLDKDPWTEILLDDFRQKDLEIVGNIHENPELLENKKED